MENLKKIITEKEIADRVDVLATQINCDYGGEGLVVMCVLSGSVIFLADLIRRLNMPLTLDMISVTSYSGDATAPSRLKFLKMFSEDVRDRHVLVLDDICDTGATLDEIMRRVSAMKPKSVRSCVLLDKPTRRVREVEPDYIAFEVPDKFVVGYGLDFNGRFRNLPYVAEIDEV